MFLRALRRAPYFAALVALSCSLCSKTEKLTYSQPFAQGDWWLYEDPNDKTYLDTVTNLGDTTYQGGIQAWRLYSNHAGNNPETTLAFTRNDTLYHYTATAGFFPDTVVVGTDTFRPLFQNSHLEVAWLPLALNLGDVWVAASDTGAIERRSGGAYDTFALNVSVTAVFDSVETVTYDTLTFPDAYRVHYRVKLDIPQLFPIDMDLSKIWWYSGVGDVRHWAFDYQTPLEQWLKDYNVR